MAKVLVVDDDAAFRSAVERMLVGLGHDVRVAGDGSEAHRAMRREPVDVVLLDVYMPVEDGLEATRRLAHECPEVPLLVISGGGALPPDMTLILAKRLGAFATLRKPFSRDALKAALDRALGRGTGCREGNET